MVSFKMGRLGRRDSTEDENQHEQELHNQWLAFGSRIAIRVCLHPFEYAKVLIQLGYEPIPPRMGHTIFGRPALVLPNIFQYVSYIRRKDGLVGCYKGLTPRLVGSILGSFGSERVADALGLEAVTDEETAQADTNDDIMYKNFQKKLKRELVVTTTEIIISQPFQVISVRMMAQFIGQESQYTSILGSIREIVASEGLGGLFSGLAPRLITELSCSVLLNGSNYVLGKYLIKDPVGLAYTSALVGLVLQSVFYPFQLVSTCMSVSGTKLLAGRPPQMPNYMNWRNCWQHLSSSNELKRGSALYFRYVAMPKTGAKFKAMPLPELPSLK